MKDKSTDRIAYLGTATNDNAVAGNVGEYAVATIAGGSAVTLTTNTPANITTLSLTPGDWDVWGQVDYVTTTATASHFKSGISTSTGAFDAQDTFADLPLSLTALSDTFGHQIDVRRISIAATTTIYLVGQATFSSGTVKGYGSIFARRVR